MYIILGYSKDLNKVLFLTSDKDFSTNKNDAYIFDKLEEAYSVYKLKILDAGIETATWTINEIEIETTTKGFFVHGCPDIFYKWRARDTINSRLNDIQAEEKVLIEELTNVMVEISSINKEI